MKKTLLVLSAVCFLSLSAFAEEEPAGPPSETPSQSAPQDDAWKLFEVGGFIAGALPGDFSNYTGSPKNGFGLGYGFNAGIRPFPYVTFGAILDGIFHGMNVASTSEDEFGSNVAAGLTAKVYPMGDWGPRAYLLVGFSYYKLHVTDGFEPLPTEDTTGATFSGHRYSLGFGYDFQILERVVVFTELDLSRQILKRRVFSTSPSVALPVEVNRWCPTLRVGVLVHF